MDSPWCVATFGLSIVGYCSFKLWWDKKMEESKKMLHYTHGAKIKLRWWMRLFNYVELLFQKTTGRYLLTFSGRTYIPDKTIKIEKELLETIGELPCSEKDFEFTQREGIRLFTSVVDNINFPWTGFGRIAQFLSLKREFTAR